MHLIQCFICIRGIWKMIKSILLVKVLQHWTMQQAWRVSSFQQLYFSLLFCHKRDCCHKAFLLVRIKLIWGNKNYNPLQIKVSMFINLLCGSWISRCRLSWDGNNGLVPQLSMNVFSTLSIIHRASWGEKGNHHTLTYYQNNHKNIYTIY